MSSVVGETIKQDQPWSGALMCFNPDDGKEDGRTSVSVAVPGPAVHF